MGRLARREQWEPRVLPARRVWMGSKGREGTRVRLVSRERLDLRVLKERPEPRARRVSERPVQRARRALQALQESLGPRVWTASKEIGVLQAQRGHREQLAPRAPRGQPVPRELRVLGRRGQPVLLATREQRGPRDWMDSMALVVSRVPPAFREPQVQPEPRERQARWALRESGQQGLRALRVALVLPVLQVHRGLTD